MTLREQEIVSEMMALAPQRPPPTTSLQLASNPEYSLDNVQFVRPDLYEDVTRFTSALDSSTVLVDWQRGSNAIIAQRRALVDVRAVRSAFDRLHRAVYEDLLIAEYGSVAEAERTWAAHVWRTTVGLPAAILFGVVLLLWGCVSLLLLIGRRSIAIAVGPVYLRLGEHAILWDDIASVDLDVSRPKVLLRDGGQVILPRVHADAEVQHYLQIAAEDRLAANLGGRGDTEARKDLTELLKSAERRPERRRPPVDNTTAR
jgi:hypothetical protein